MPHPRLVSVLPAGLSLALLAPLACTDAEPEAPAAESPKAAPAAPTPTDSAPVPPDDAPAVAEADEGLSAMLAQATGTSPTPDGRLDHGAALGHIVVARPAQFLQEVRTQVAPAERAAVLDETALRTVARMFLGERSGLADHLSLDGPMGCVLVDDTTVDIPVACTVAYIGGAEAAIADLGPDERQADAQGHLARYRVEGQDLYVDDLAGQVVVTNHTAVFAKAKDYLTTTVIGRAGSIEDDIEVVVFPKAGMTRYSKELDSVLTALRSIPAAPDANPLSEALTDYSRASLERSVEYYRELDQVDMGLSLEEVGFVMRYAVFPTPGSRTQSDTQAIATGPVDLSIIRQMPASSWMLTGSTVDWKAVWGLESAAAMRDAILEAYAAAIGGSASDIRTAVESFLDENAGLYDDDMAVALAHLPGTQGGLIVGRKIAAPARERWKPWTETFTPEAVLGPEGTKFVTWSFEPDALTVDGVAVDRWTIEPGSEAMAKIAASKEPAIAELTRRFGGLRLIIDRVELRDRVLFVMAPGHQQEYIRAAIAATTPGGASGSAGVDAGLTALLTRNPGTSVVAAVNVAGALSWAVEVLPPEATRKAPVGLGKDLGDFYFSATYGASGQQHGEMVLSQSMIDGLRLLAK